MKQRLIEQYAPLIEQFLKAFSPIYFKDEGKVEDGDTAVIDFLGTVDGKELEGGKGENFPLEIGSHTFIPGFEEGVVGMKVGEEKDLDLEFPKDYVKDLAGKKVKFHVTLHEIKTRVLPDIDEDFFKDLGYDKVTNAKELETEVEKVIKERKTQEIDDRFLEEVLSKASENMEIEIPEEMLDDEVHRMMHQMEEQLKMQGITMEQYMQFSKLSHEDIFVNIQESIQKNIQDD